MHPAHHPGDPRMAGVLSMSTFTLDTSGVVHIRTEPHGDWRGIGWSDLTPFAQGYVEAAKQSRRLIVHRVGGDELDTFDWAFSDLAPETLAAMLKDCEAHELAYPLQAADPRRHNRGFNFWRNRQAGMWTASGWPPVALYLGDDGKIQQREAR